MKLVRHLAALLCAAAVAGVALFGAARADQSSVVTPTVGPHTMTDFATNFLNPALLALLTHASGTAAPANGPGAAAAAYQFWFDTSGAPKVLKVYDGAQWVAIGNLDAVAHTWAPLWTGHTVAALDINQTWTGTQAFNDGKLIANGSSSGSSTIKAPATGGGTVTLFAGSDTVVGKATTDTLTNKTFDTAGAGNSLLINGLAAAANTGTGAVARATSAALTSPAISGGTIDNATIGATTAAAATITALNATQTFALSGVISPAQITADQNDYSPAGLSTATVLLLTSDAARTITGLAAPAQAGRSLMIHNSGSNNIVLSNGSGSSAAANRFLFDGPVTLASNTQITLWYDQTNLRWRPWGRALINSGVTAASYGSTTQVGTFTVDLQGRLTAAANASISASGIGALVAANNLSDVTAATARTNLGLGTAATQNTGTSGAALPFLNGANTWSGTQAFSAAVDVQQTFQLSGDISPTQITADQNDYNPTNLATSATLRLSTDAARNITGLQGGSDGRIVTIYNVGSFGLVLKDESASSSAANRFGFGGDLTITTKQGATLQYDSTSSRWRVIGSPLGGGGGAVSSVFGRTGGVVATAGDYDATQIYKLPLIAGGRLTLTTGTPVMTSSVTGGTTVYYTLYVHPLVPIYDGTRITMKDTLGELSAALGSNWAANKNYDWFIANDSGTIRLCSGPDWTAGAVAGSDTARGTGAGSTDLERPTGVGLLVNKNSMTCRYNNTTTITCAVDQCTFVGTTRTNGSTGQVDYIFGAAASGGTAARLTVWNMYNRVNVSTIVRDSGAAYTYTTATTRQARASAGNQVVYVYGLNEEPVACTYRERISTVAASGAFGQWGCGVDSTTAMYLGQYAFLSAPTANAFLGVNSAGFSDYLGLGLHTISANELGDGSNANTFNVGSDAGLTVNLRM